jgi:quinohemoprotein ethanol dehydrogenase
MPPSPPPFFPTPRDVPGLEIDEELAAAGVTPFVEGCFWCHGAGAVSGGNGPDLRASPVTLSFESFREVVLKGRVPLGMPAFHDYKDGEINALFHYIRQQARRAVKANTESAAAAEAAP